MNTRRVRAPVPDPVSTGGSCPIRAAVMMGDSSRPVATEPADGASATMDGVDPFTVLGVTSAASADEVAAAYRELAKAWHPDRRGRAGEERMAEINVAYELLRA